MRLAATAAAAAAALTLILPAPALAEPPRVVVDTLIVESIAAYVGEGAGIAPHVLMDEAGSSHHGSLRPSDMAALAEADVLIWAGPDMTPWLVPVAEAQAESGLVLELLATEGWTRLPAREEPVFARADDGAGVMADGAKIDPHAWLDPRVARAWADAMAGVFAEADPGNAALYAANAARFAEAAAALEAEVAALVEPLADLSFVVAHDAYQYFEHRFGLRPVAAILPAGAHVIGPGRVSALHDAMIARGVTCLLADQTTPADLIGLVAEATAPRIIEADPEGWRQADAPGRYAATLRTLARDLRACASEAPASD